MSKLTLIAYCIKASCEQDLGGLPQMDFSDWSMSTGRTSRLYDSAWNKGSRQVDLELTQRMSVASDVRDWLCVEINRASTLCTWPYQSYLLLRDWRKSKIIVIVVLCGPFIIAMCSICMTSMMSIHSSPSQMSIHSTSAMMPVHTSPSTICTMTSAIHAWEESSHFCFQHTCHNKKPYENVLWLESLLELTNNLDDFLGFWAITGLVVHPVVAAITGDCIGKGSQQYHKLHKSAFLQATCVLIGTKKECGNKQDIISQR